MCELAREKKLWDANNRPVSVESALGMPLRALSEHTLMRLPGDRKKSPALNLLVRELYQPLAYEWLASTFTKSDLVGFFVAEHSLVGVMDLMHRWLLQAAGHRPLVAFFIRERLPSGFFDWADPLPRPSSHLQRVEKTTPAYTATLSWSLESDFDDGPRARTNEAANLDSLVWYAALQPPAKNGGPRSNTVWAVASGTLHLMERDRFGWPRATPEQLLAHARRQESRRADILEAFFLQHADALELLTRSDLCTLESWERHPTAPPGAGADLLVETVGSLQRSAPWFDTLVVDLQPLPFTSGWPENAPAHLQLQRHEAAESLERFIFRATPELMPQGNLRAVLARTG